MVGAVGVVVAAWALPPAGGGGLFFFYIWGCEAVEMWLSVDGGWWMSCFSSPWSGPLNEVG